MPCYTPERIRCLFVALARRAKPVVCMVSAFVCLTSAAQQQADGRFRAVVADPAYPVGQGPSVVIDEAHHNFHTAHGRYAAFAELLRLDGYRVSAGKDPFTMKALAKRNLGDC